MITKKCIVFKAIALILGLLLICCERDMAGTYDMVGKYVEEGCLKRSRVPVLCVHNLSTSLTLQENGAYVGLTLGPGVWEKREDKIMLIGKFGGRVVLKIKGGKLIEYKSGEKNQIQRVWIQIPKPFLEDRELLNLWIQSQGKQEVR